MPSPQTMALFMVSALALNLTPGPAILFILSRSFGQGRAAAVISVFGLAAASVLQAVAAAFGLSALFVYSPLAFAIVKYCGATYLVYLGITGFLSGGLAGITSRAEPGRRRSLARAYWQGLLTDLLNPKLLLFFFSFLPQFVDPARGEPSLQMLVLGLLFQVTGVPTNLAVALGGGTLAALIARHPFWAGVQRWCSSAVLIGLGIRLALSDRR
ncbi:MAG TPA: LysE family translocator [Stellaceae bacterium]|nr:LysE family translocator [Stellaceae bacterium]